jgi:dolichol kinase/phosphoserine phosphatase
MVRVIAKNIPRKRLYNGLVVFDVDGVLYKGIFLKKLVQSRGLINYIKILFLGINYYINRISLQKLLEDGYRLARDFDVRKARSMAEKIKKVTNIKETIHYLHQNNHYVSLISAGIPNFILKDLAVEINADHYSGLNIEVERGSLKVDKIQTISKVDIVQNLLKELKLKWEDVVSVADDPNNIDLLKKSGLGIGFNPSKIIRQNSDVIVEGYDFLEIIPHIIPSGDLPRDISLKKYVWRREIIRKGIHLLGCAVPFIAKSFRTATVYTLLSIIVVFFLSELLRYSGISFWIFSHVAKRAQRLSETRGIIIGPILLALGIVVTLLFFDYSIYMPAILVVSISDVFSALIGIRFGRIRILNLKNRTIEGSCAFLLSSFFILLLTFPLPVAIPTAILATALELFPFYNLDNFFIPVGTALFLHLMMKVMI